MKTKISLILSVFMFSCTMIKSLKENQKKMYIHHDKTTCQGVGFMQCLLLKEK